MPLWFELSSTLAGVVAALPIFLIAEYGGVLDWLSSFLGQAIAVVSISILTAIVIVMTSAIVCRRFGVLIIFNGEKHG